MERLPRYELGLVAAPRCESCGAQMVGYDSTQWVCVAVDCKRKDIPTAVPGVFPFRKLLDLPPR